MHRKLLRSTNDACRSDARLCILLFGSHLDPRSNKRSSPPKAFGLSSRVHRLAARVSSIRMQQLPVTIYMHTHGANRAYLWIIWWNLCQTAEYEKTTGAKHRTRYVYARSMSIIKVKSKPNKILKLIKCDNYFYAFSKL